MYYAHRFCGSGIQTGHSRDGSFLLQEVWGLSWKPCGLKAQSLWRLVYSYVCRLRLAVSLGPLFENIYLAALGLSLLINIYLFIGASLLAQNVKNLLIIRETQLWSLGREQPLEKGMATHSSILAWRIPWAEEPGRLQFMGSQRVTNTFTFIYLFDMKDL